MPERPMGTVTFLFTDIEGSTTRWEHHPEAMRTALARHDALLRSIITAHDGLVFKMIGDAVYAAFAVAADAVAAAVAGQRAVAAEEWGEVGPLRVRMALHTGAVQNRDDDYFGPTLNRVVRLLSAGYGGQVLLSAATQELARDGLPAGMSLEDLGEHALKDLLRPEHVYQLTSPDLPGDFPALKSLSRRPHNLPMQPTSLIGREQEVASVCELLRRPQVCLVTLSGPAGVGKTRLALQVVAELADQYADGVFLVPLVPVSNPDMVASAIIQTLGIKDLNGHSPLTLLKGALKDKQMLLLLDNFEQVAAAAVQVAELLAVCPKLKVLVTSRVVLHVRAEHEFAVPPLALPNLKCLPNLVALSQFEAVALFIERAQAVKPDFQLTDANAQALAAICARLDGLPLAIELAAAHVKYFPPQTLLARLEQGLSVLSGGARDLPARQQTLRGAIAWSYDLLEPEEQQLFRRLSVFVNGCTLEAAEQVCTAAGQLSGDVLEGLVSLVDKSLLRQIEEAEGTQVEGEPRFWMLQTLREFGLESLTSAGETEVTREAHAAHYLVKAEEAELGQAGAHQALWLEQLEREHENLRAALSWLMQRTEAEDLEKALRLAGALWWFWSVRGYVSEGRQWLDRALARSAGASAAIRAKLLSGAGMLALNQDEYDLAETFCRESLALFRERGDKRESALSLYRLGLAAWWKCNYTAVRSLEEEALTLYRQMGDKGGAADPLLILSRLALVQGNYAEAYSLAEESLALFREVGDKWGLAYVFHHLACVIFAQGNVARARTTVEEGLALSRELGYKEGIADALALLGQFAFQQGDTALAHSLLAESQLLFREVGDRRGTARSLCLLAKVIAA